MDRHPEFQRLAGLKVALHQTDPLPNGNREHLAISLLILRNIPASFVIFESSSRRNGVPDALAFAPPGIGPSVIARLNEAVSRFSNFQFRVSISLPNGNRAEDRARHLADNKRHSGFAQQHLPPSTSRVLRPYSLFPTPFPSPFDLRPCLSKSQHNPGERALFGVEGGEFRVERKPMDFRTRNAADPKGGGRAALALSGAP